MEEVALEKTTYIFNSIREKIKGKTRFILFVPEQFSFQQKIIYQILLMEIVVLMQVLTLSRMADRVIENTVGNGKSHLCLQLVNL